MTLKPKATSFLTGTKKSMPYRQVPKSCFLFGAVKPFQPKKSWRAGHVSCCREQARRAKRQRKSSSAPTVAIIHTRIAVCRMTTSSTVMIWVLPPLSDRRIISMIWLYIALNRTPNIDCYWGGGGQYPNYDYH